MMLVVLFACAALVVITPSSSLKAEFFCGDSCTGTREGCSCEEACLTDNTCCTDYYEKCQGGTSWLDDDCAEPDEMVCPPGYQNPPLILLSLDGFRNTYLDKEATKSMWKLANCGVHSPFMRPAYPSKTFTSHYTTITGLYPESNGLIDNKMYDPEYNQTFSLGSSTRYDPYWWQGEPFWVTVQKHGLKSASLFYPGDDVNITKYPNYYYEKYDQSLPNEKRVYQILEWIDMSQDERPSYIGFYTDIVDTYGHLAGPYQPETNAAVEEVDAVIGMLMDGLKMRNLSNCVNFIVVADHGMADTSNSRRSYLDDYDIEAKDYLIFARQALARIGPKPPASNSQFDAKYVLNQTECKKDSHWRSYLKSEYLPKRLHYANNQRIEDVIIMMDDEWLIEQSLSAAGDASRGSHGYDNNFVDMRSVFVAHGSSMKRSLNSTYGFEAIEVYNLLADLLNVEPSPNNGTRGSLHHLLKNPKDVNKESEDVVLMQCPLPPPDAGPGMGCVFCEGISKEEADQRLDMEEEEVDELVSKHLPFGQDRVTMPIGAQHFCILTQQDYISAYDNNIKQPRYVSFLKTTAKATPSEISCIREDKRTPNATACSDYGSDGMKQMFLYDPMLSEGNAQYDATLTSNTIPVFEDFVPVWKAINNQLNFWTVKYNGLHVIAGPLFDYDYDGIADSNEVLKKKANFLQASNETPIPTHIFIIVTKSKASNKPITDCLSSPHEIESLSFAIPNYNRPICMENENSIEKELKQHVARIKDIELLSGLAFYTNWVTGAVDQSTYTATIRNKVALAQPDEQWINDIALPSSQPTASPTITPTSSVARLSASNTLVMITFLCLLF